MYPLAGHTEPFECGNKPPQEKQDLETGLGASTMEDRIGL